MTQHIATAMIACTMMLISGNRARLSQPENAVKTAGIQNATLTQYIQPTRTLGNSPKARPTQLTIPPSSG